MRLSQTEITQFAAWSADCNPLHVDLPAARQTSYGRTIAHGMLVSLEALRQLDPPDAAPLVSIDAEFRGPVFPDRDYELRSTATDAGWRLTVADGEQTLLILTAGKRPLSDSQLQSAEPAERPTWTERIKSRQVRETPADRPVEEMRSGLELTGLYDRHVPLAASDGGPLTAQQANVLGLCSYLVGMELPGLRSVFTRLQLTFHDRSAEATPLVYRLATKRFDERFRLLDTVVEVATPAGAPVATAELRSYVRFSPVVTDVRQLAAALPTSSNRLKDKVALICGGSRGLGADLVASLALAGCQVYINCRHTTEAVERLIAEIEACGGKAELLPGDAADAEWCVAAREQILARHGRLDLLVLNACAAPHPTGFATLLQPSGSSYVADNLRLVQMPLAALLPTVDANRGTVVAVSSSFVTEPPAEFGEYVALKHAVEGLVRSAAREFPRAAYLLPRPPRLQTSWNDTPTGVLGTIPSAQAAVSIVKRLASASTAGQVETLEQFPPLATRSAPSGSANEPAANEPASGERPADFHLILAASFTAEPLLPGLEFWKRELGWSAELRTAPYGQVIQELLNPASGMAANPRGLNVVVLRVADWLRELPDETRQSAERLSEFLRATAQEFVAAVRAHRQRAAVETLLVLCPSNSAPGSDQHLLLAQIEQQLLAQLRGLGGLGILVAGDFHAAYDVPEDAVHDPLRDKIAHVPYQDGYLHLLSTLVARYLQRRLARVRKVVVVDCDNTLWKGVVGEVGAAGVEFEEGHRALHAKLNQLSASGMLVCLCSKNEELDVWSVFEQREDFGLRREQIVAAMINWQPKSENLRKLAGRLNLGLDSFVFLDDNPVECAEVRAACPEVLTLPWPQQADEACRLLRHTWELDLDEGTDEDRRRTQLYQEEFQRQELQDQQVSFRDFIERLELVVDIQPLSEPDVPRAAQLTLRTNQFNFTTRRREAGQLQQLLGDPLSSCHTVRVRDRFGDYGLVGLMIAQQRERLLEVDTLLLSCRVLGRGVEWAMAAELGRVALQRGAERVLFRVATTSKNAPARKFLQALAPDQARRGDDKLLECELSADYVQQLRFEPEEAPATGADSAEPRPAPAQSQPAQSQPAQSLRQRERQIMRAAGELGTLAR
ncbi:MAG: SDR family NAD(P)-dependent oxidoreductase, partial [Pirellulaceae bacterium]|nr:SDR family NAD(P)-dependent oxidoreductase [Pirellulaceae bacterium]